MNQINNIFGYIDKINLIDSSIETELKENGGLPTEIKTQKHYNLIGSINHKYSSISSYFGYFISEIQQIYKSKLAVLDVIDDIFSSINIIDDSINITRVNSKYFTYISDHLHFLKYSDSGINFKRSIQLMRQIFLRRKNILKICIMSDQSVQPCDHMLVIILSLKDDCIYSIYLYELRVLMLLLSNIAREFI